MTFWSADGSERGREIDEEPSWSDEGSQDWARRIHEEALGQSGERIEHEGLEAAEPTHRDRPLREFRERFPGEYSEPWETTVPTERFRPPERFVAEINPHYAQSPEHQVNCCDCARAVERTWRGHREVAAGRATGFGEGNNRMENWAGVRYRSVDAAEIRGRLAAAGPGSSAILSAIVTSESGVRSGHAFNAINDQGEIKAVDGQVGMVEPWSDRTGHPYVRDVLDDDGSPGRLMAMGWDPQGRPLW